jgi:predicted DsbA family dithiol-disulfide isomerase
MSKLSFGHWTDPLCIWAFVAQDQLERLLAELAHRLTVDYRVVPVFGSVPWRFTQGGWASGGVDGRARATAEIAAAHGHPEVDGSCWRNDCPASSWAPAAAIKAVAALEREGVVEPGATGQYQHALRRRFFVDCRNIARRAVQLETAEALGLSRADIERRLDDGSALALLCEDLEEKERRKLQGSPTYVFDQGRAMLYGNVTYGVLHATVEELLREVHCLQSIRAFGAISHSALC